MVTTDPLGTGDAVPRFAACGPIRPSHDRLGRGGRRGVPTQVQPSGHQHLRGAREGWPAPCGHALVTAAGGRSPPASGVATHFDHTFGNQVFTGVPIYGHQRVPAHLAAYEAPMLAEWLARGEEPVEEWAEVEITPPTVLVGQELRIVVGDRFVDLLHLGRGHTDNDIVLHVPDASAWIVGDLVEESGPPMYGSGCFPLEWPGTSAALANRLGQADVVVPGHGKPVTRPFVEAQQAQLAALPISSPSSMRLESPRNGRATRGAGRWPLPPEARPGDQRGIRGAVVVRRSRWSSRAPGQVSPPPARSSSRRRGSVRSSG